MDRKKVDELNGRAWQVHIDDPEKGLELSKEAKRIAEEISYPLGLAYAIRNMGVSHRYLSNLDTALTLSFQALEMFKQLKERSAEAQSYVSIGALYYYTGDFDSSLDYFLKGLHLSEEVGNREALAYAYNGTGYAYGILQEDHKKGLEYLHKALELSKQPGISPDLQPRVLDCIAGIYLKDGQVEKAYEAAFECLRVSRESSQTIPTVDALLGLGIIFFSTGRLDEAEDYFQQAVTLCRKINHSVGESYTLLYLGKLAIQKKEEDKAKKYLFTALEVAEKVKAKAVIYEVHEALAEFYEIRKDFPLFVKHYKLYHEYKTEVFKDQQENKQKYQAIQFEMEKLQQEAEITRLTNVVMKEKNEELEKKTRELEQSYNTVSVLSDIGREITSTLSLDTILNTVYVKVNELMDASIFGIGIYDRGKMTIEYRLSIENGKRYQPYQRDMTDKTQLAVWCIENNKEVFINNVNNESSNYIKPVAGSAHKPHLIKATLEDGSLPQYPNSIIYLPLQVKDDIIGLISVQSYQTNAYTQYHLDILKTLASYTSAALYNAQSFETLENTLKELKVAQQQLIQSEKMASLGELTAGIAHEIQNPLNFVNNFSEVNRELIDEMNMQLDTANWEEARNLSRDIRANEEKISLHGKRADAIVRSMLMHSRTGSGKKEETDINALADEYLRLAFHGQRARDKSFNARFETDFDQSLGKINAVPQDIGRVLLNLINNALFAVDEKRRMTPGDYQPFIRVSSCQKENKVEIKVSDNGIGIPEKTIEKIFHPFFTTKATGQGTGLGLSLSYDIIKAHGGEIKVSSREGEGSDFVVSLPAGG
jgi:signal transduction histidine kinase